jgi:two-component system, cell cycle response regulator DivK
VSQLQSLILLADPSPVQREMYSEYLRWSGFRVEQCEAGLEAFKRSLVLKPDLVCASFVMDRGSGVELCAALHADARTSHIPVIILTTMTTTLEMQKAMSAGCDALLVKPCLPEHLAAEAARLIAESRRRDRRARQPRPPKDARLGP